MVLLWKKQYAPNAINNFKRQPVIMLSFKIIFDLWEDSYVYWYFNEIY